MSAPREATVEVRRCQRDLAKHDSGYRRDMWRRRLDRAAKLWEAAAAILRAQIAAIDRDAQLKSDAQEGTIAGALAQRELAKRSKR
jgi:hypothetical protein